MANYRIVDLTTYPSWPTGNEIAEISNGGNGSYQIPIAELAYGRTAYNGQFPLDTGATFIGSPTSGSIAKGIDFSNITFSGNAWTSTGASIDGSGNLTAITVTSSGYVKGTCNSQSIPGSQSTTFFICDNFSSGNGEVNFFNLQTNAAGFTWNQKTGASTQTQLASLNYSNSAGLFTVPVINATGTTASSSTSTGAIVDSGGLGVAGAVYVGGNLNVVSGTAFISTTSATNPTLSFFSTGGGEPNNSFWDTTAGYAIFLSSGAMYFGILNSSGAYQSNAADFDTTGNFHLLKTTAASSTSTGALTVAGGLGVAGALYATIASSGAALAYTCYNSSTGQFTYDSAATCLVSSLRFKHAVAPLTNSLDVISKIDPISFTYNDQTVVKGEQEGISAESMAHADPLLVEYDAEGLPLKPKLMGLIGRLVGAVKELKANNDEIEYEIKNLRIVGGSK